MLTQAGQDVFHPEVVPGLLGGKIGRPQAKVLGVRKNFPKRFNICGMFPIFFFPLSLREEIVSKGTFFSRLDAATSVLQNVIVFRA